MQTFPEIGHNVFLRLFPPPVYMRMPAVGIDISSQSVRFLQFERSHGGAKIKIVGEEKIPEGAYNSEEIHENDRLVKILTDIRERYGFHFVCASLPDEKAYLFKISVPQLSEKEMRDHIELKLEENVPLATSEVLFDYSIISVIRDPKSESALEAAVSVFPKQVAESHARLFAMAGLMPRSFHIAAEAVARALVRRGDAGTYLIVNFGEKKTGIFVVSREVVLFGSTLNFGGEAMTLGIQKHFGVDRAKAVEIKRDASLLADKETMTLFFSLMNPISALRDEINRLYLYWNTHEDRAEEDRAKIDRVILCGGDSRIRGLDEYLSLSLGVPVDLADIWTNAFSLEKYLPSLAHDDSLDYAAAAGLALEGIY